MSRLKETPDYLGEAFGAITQLSCNRNQRNGRYDL